MRARTAAAALSLLTLSCALWAHSSRADSQALSDAAYHIRRYAAIFEFTEEITIRVVPESQMPIIRRGTEEFEIQGYASRRQGGPGCELTFIDAAVRSRLALAHETCHCILDHEVLVGARYKPGVTLQDVLRREQSAIACSVWLTDDSAEGNWARRKREYPAEIGFAGGKRNHEGLFE